MELVGPLDRPVNPARAGMIPPIVVAMAGRRVNPARAGMILLMLSQMPPSASKPRASGDDPSRMQTTVSIAAVVNPARAGMILSLPDGRSIRSR